VGGNLGYLDALDLRGTVEVVGNLIPGNNHVYGISGLLHVHGDLLDNQLVVPDSLAGELRIGGSVRVPIHFGSNGRSEAPMSGRISIGYGDPNVPGDCSAAILVGDRDMYPMLRRDLTGSIEIAGGLHGLIDVTGYLGDPNDPNDTTFKGHIRIDGPFATDPNAPTDPNDPNAPRIRIGGRLVGATSYVAVDYDGYHAGDEWLSPATVVVEQPDPNDPNAPAVVYTETSWAAPIYPITPCKGDMNNDETVGFADINPFILALSNPSAYAIAWPGLAGSMVYHGDVNCDGTLGFGDISPFVALLANPCCQTTCAPCEGDGLGNRAPGEGNDAPAWSAEQLAALLAANVDPELYDSLVTLVGENAGQQDNEADAAYWEAVYYALIE
jgi:hypothetical protein